MILEESLEEACRTMKEFRCEDCGRLLFKYDDDGHVEHRHRCQDGRQTKSLNTRAQEPEGRRAPESTMRWTGKPPQKGNDGRAARHPRGREKGNKSAAELQAALNNLQTKVDNLAQYLPFDAEKSAGHEKWMKRARSDCREGSRGRIQGPG